jgi:hypothetical protein
MSQETNKGEFKTEMLFGLSIPIIVGVGMIVFLIKMAPKH